MKKKLTALCAVLAVLGGIMPSAFAADVPEKTEISFKVGDSTLTVNGQPMEVTAPYVVGEGTTLVPIRVITEAFGAEVNWNGEEQSVNLKYPDVDITIKIGSKSAQVNTHTEELLAAPELYNDTTMVPLRFISETFGARVDYNDGLITVTKEAAEEQTSTVEGVTDKEFIGDSYYGWTIKNPKNYSMSERSFDGTETDFDYDSGKSGVSVFVDKYDEDIDIDTEFSKWKSNVSDGSISIADKKQLSNGYTYIHFRSKTKDDVKDIQAYIKEKTRFLILAVANNDDKVEDELLDISQSFSLSEKRDFYDLSNVENDSRSFEDNEYNISIRVPAGWTQYEKSSPNLFVFYDANGGVGKIGIEVSSKSESATAEKLAQSDRETKAEIVNADLVKVSDVKNEEFAGENAYCYEVDYNGFGDSKKYLKDMFIELGDYIYNVSATAADQESAEKILATFKASAPDSSKLGNIIRSSEIASNSGKAAVTGGKLTLKNYWQSGTAGMFIYESRSGAVVMPMGAASVVSGQSVKSMAEDTFSKIDDLGTIVGSMKTESSNGHTFYIKTYKLTKDNVNTYSTVYLTAINKRMYAFNYVRNDIYYGGGLDTEADEIIKGFEAAE